MGYQRRVHGSSDRTETSRRKEDVGHVKPNSRSSSAKTVSKSSDRTESSRRKEDVGYEKPNSRSISTKTVSKSSARTESSRRKGDVGNSRTGSSSTKSNPHSQSISTKTVVQHRTESIYTSSENVGPEKKNRKPPIKVTQPQGNSEITLQKEDGEDKNQNFGRKYMPKNQITLSSGTVNDDNLSSESVRCKRGAELCSPAQTKKTKKK